jgi:putative aldouronate transport system permease protein
LRYQRSFGERAVDVFLYIFLAVVAFTAVFPFIHLFVLSLNEAEDAMRGGLYFFPRKFTLYNYEFVFSHPQLLTATFNSVARTVLQTAISVFCNGMVAYALSRREFIYRRLFSFLLVLTMYVNGGLIPTYLLIKGLGLMNTFAVYIVPGILSAFYIMVMRSFFEQLPDGLVESGYMDGAGDFRIYSTLILPISLPVLACIALFVAVSEWNQWFDNFLYNNRNPKLAVLQYEMQKLLDSVTIPEDLESVDPSERRMTPYVIKATLTMVVTIPIMMVYPFLQRYFVQGLTLGAMKG